MVDLKDFYRSSKKSDSKLSDFYRKTEDMDSRLTAPLGLDVDLRLSDVPRKDY